MNQPSPVILCVDDEEANIKLLENILVPRGYMVVSAASGKDALLKIKSQVIDLVLLDVIMPEMDGFEVCRQIKEDQKLRNIPVIIITALTARQDHVRGIEAGAEEFLSKPIEKTVALARIKRLLKMKALSDERLRAEKALQKANEELDSRVRERTAELSQANEMLQADIAERILVESQKKTALDELRKSEENFRLSLAESPLGVRVVTAEGETLYANRAIADIYGCDSIEELKGAPLKELYTPQSYAEFRIRKEKRVRGEFGPSEYEISIVRKNGEVRQLHVFRKEIIWNGARQYQVIYQDITDRKRADEKLRENEELLRNYLEYAPDGVYTNDLNGTFLYGNRKCEEIIGYRREELIGKNFLELNILPDQSLNKALELLQENMKGMPTGPDEIEMISKAGHLIPIEINTSVVQRSGEGIVLAFVRDITERKLADEKLLRTLENLQKAFATIIQVMVSTVEMRDPYTAGHQLRVADMACAIAAEMGLPREIIDEISMAGAIHDIGKLSIPAEILSKPTKLTNNEFNLIKEHSQSGYEMLKNVESPWPLAQIVYQHHERTDGSGYPQGLKGDEILMEARIMAVADVVEAMASHRPYRAALGIDVALKEIEKNRGILYDDAVASACLKLFREKDYILPA